MTAPAVSDRLDALTRQLREIAKENAVTYMTPVCAAVLRSDVAAALADVVEGVARRHRITQPVFCDCGKVWPCPEVTAFDPVCDLLLGTGKEQR